MNHLVPLLKNIIPLPHLLPELDVSPCSEVQGTAKGLWIEPETLVRLINGWLIATWAIEMSYRLRPVLKPGQGPGRKLNH